jgi:hypothetical protein
VGAPLAVTKDNVVEVLERIRAVLGEQNAAKAGMWVVFPEWFRFLLMNSDLKVASLMGDPRSVQRSGIIGEIDGMTLAASNLLKGVTDTAHACTYIMAGNKDAMLQQLQSMFAAQTQIGMSIGIADPKTVYNTATEISKLQGFAQPERFWTDPAQKPPPQPQPPPEVQVAQMRLQADQQKTQAQLQADQQKTQMQAQVDSQRAQVELQAKQQMEQQQLAFEKWKTEFQASVDLQIASMKEDKATEREITKLSASSQLEGIRMEREDAKAMKEDVVGQTLSQIGQQVQQLSQFLSMSKVAGIEKLRGPDGRMVAARIKRADGSTDEVPIQ